MKHAIHRVISFEIVSPFTLCVRLEDRTEQTIDFEPVRAGELYGPLHDLELFDQVQIDSDAHTLVWPNGADFDPATLHDWPKHVEELSKQARQWNSVAAGPLHSADTFPPKRT